MIMREAVPSERGSHKHRRAVNKSLRSHVCRLSLTVVIHLRGLLVRVSELMWGNVCTYLAHSKCSLVSLKDIVHYSKRVLIFSIV